MPHIELPNNKYIT